MRLRNKKKYWPIAIMFNDWQNVPFWEEVIGEREDIIYWDREEAIWIGSDALSRPKRREYTIPPKYWTYSRVGCKIYFRCHLCHSQALIDDPTFKLRQSPSDWQLLEDYERLDDLCTCLNEGCNHSCRNCVDCRIVAGFIRAQDYAFIIKDAFDGIDRTLLYGNANFEQREPMVCIGREWKDPGFTYHELFGSRAKPGRTSNLVKWMGSKQSSRAVPGLYAHCCQCGLPKTHPNSWLYYKVTQIDHGSKKEQLECVQAHPDHNPWQCPSCIRVLGKSSSIGHIYVEWLFQDSFVAARQALLQNPLFRTTTQYRVVVECSTCSRRIFEPWNEFG